MRTVFYRTCVRVEWRLVLHTVGIAQRSLSRGRCSTRIYRWGEGVSLPVLGLEPLLGHVQTLRIMENWTVVHLYRAIGELTPPWLVIVPVSVDLYPIYMSWLVAQLLDVDTVV